MNPPSSLTLDGPILTLNSGASPASSSIMPWLETSAQKSTIEANLLAQVESLWQDMAKIQQTFPCPTPIHALSGGTTPRILNLLKLLRQIKRPTRATVAIVDLSHAKLNDRHLDVLYLKSPLRQTYKVLGLEETDEPDYILTSLETTISCHLERTKPFQQERKHYGTTGDETRRTETMVGTLLNGKTCRSKVQRLLAIILSFDRSRIQ
ncbi:hypothetical protein L3X38_017047 [Prunus dulcis]|uniref:Uncharacterized protein n=1 Tax=Prunus dulcis TaxID=3755 RepID=A0AAD4Z9P4_PRUDU|nr:hypothetical protein L3X38_017047 [Prunus dulcis]